MKIAAIPSVAHPLFPEQWLHSAQRTSDTLSDTSEQQPRQRTTLTPLSL